MNVTKEQIAKLPRWAQDYIRHIEGEARLANRNLEDYHNKQTPSRVYVWEYPPKNGIKGSENNFIQTDRIRVKNPVGDLVLEIYSDPRRNQIEVRAVEGEMLMVPNCGNTFHIRSWDSVKGQLH